jgi:protein TonB
LNLEASRLGLGVPAQRDSDQWLAWVNSVCILFLLIGVLGAKSAFISIKPLPTLEEVNATIIEPLPPPPQTTTEEQPQDQTEQEKPDAPQVVVVTPDAPSVNFAVPTIGNLVVPSALAKAPPISPLKAVAPLRSRPTVLDSTGSGGERPQPPYPRMALEQGQQGGVTLSLTVDDAGLITAIELKQSSGFPMLDRSALDFVKRHWIVPPGQGSRTYEATINYKLKRD